MAMAIVCLLSACRKQISETATAPATVSPSTNQISNPCQVRTDAARSARISMDKAPKTGPVILYLDFNGQRITNSAWNPGETMNCPAVPTSLLSNSARDYILNAVTEDYSAFNVKVTKNEQDFLSAPAARRMRVVITHNMMDRFGNVGGLAFIGSMLWGDNTPCFVFSDVLLHDQKYIAGAVAHELGHTFGLDHQARYDADCNQEEAYHTGFGWGSLGWAPIMGISYYQNLVTWHTGQTIAGCNEWQNDRNILASVAGVKSDDCAAALNNNTIVLPSNGVKNGVLEMSTDVDAFFKKETNTRRVILTSNGNSDLALEVYNANGQLAAVYDDPEGTDVNVVLTGKKYLRVMISPNQPYVPAGDGFGGYKVTVSAP